MHAMHGAALVGLLIIGGTARRIPGLFEILSGGEVVLGVGLMSGMALRFADTGTVMTLDHKTILTVTAFVLMGAVLLMHFRIGLRGRRAARWALAAYLFLTLGYPGVKFVTDVLIG